MFISYSYTGKAALCKHIQIDVDLLYISIYLCVFECVLPSELKYVLKGTLNLI